MSVGMGMGMMSQMREENSRSNNENLEKISNMESRLRTKDIEI